MANDACGISARDWVQQTQRASLLTDKALPRDYRAAAGRRGEFLAPLLAERTVVLLGNDVAAAMGHGLPPLVWGKWCKWVLIPPPVMQTPFYATPANCAAVGALLAGIVGKRVLT